MGNKEASCEIQRYPGGYLHEGIRRILRRRSDSGIVVFREQFSERRVNLDQRFLVETRTLLFVHSLTLLSWLFPCLLSHGDMTALRK
jgi:hypothetical protein